MHHLSRHAETLVLLSKQMSASQYSNTKFWTLTVIVLLASVGSLAALWPLATQAAHNQAHQLAKEGSSINISPAEAEADFHLATWLNPADAANWLGLARAQIAAGHPNDALISLKRAGEGSEATRLQIRTLIELGRTSEAAKAADQLTGTHATTDDLMLAGLAYALTSRTADITALTPRVNSPEALQRFRRVQAGKLPLAAELYATGLLRSSSALLADLPTSFERNLLLARIDYTRHTPGSLNQAASLLTEATALKPSDLEAHQLLAQILHDQNKTNEAAAQDLLITKLQAGRP